MSSSDNVLLISGVELVDHGSILSLNVPLMKYGSCGMTFTSRKPVSILRSVTETDAKDLLQ